METRGSKLEYLSFSTRAQGTLAQAGSMYFGGKGTERDYDAAAQYFQQAADLNDGYSLIFLAAMYERGLLGQPNRIPPPKAA